jgi:integrase
MAGAVQHAKLDSITARSRLKRGRQPHWQALVPGKVHLGWQCWKGDPQGRWVLRRYIGSHVNANGKRIGQYRTTTLGRADDNAAADGMSFAQADAAARAMVNIPQAKNHQLTVRDAVALYDADKLAAGAAPSGCRAPVHILPDLGDLVVAELTTERLRQWLTTMAAAPAQLRPRAGKPQYKAAPVTEDDYRQRRATANRTLTLLKAVLNHAFDEGHVANRDAWGRRLKPFKGVDHARMRYLQVAEAQRLLNACDEDFRQLVRAALETGCRYSELCRLVVRDFNPDSGTVHIRKSKSGKPRDVRLTEEGIAFFRQHCAGRAGDDLMLVRRDDATWKKSNQVLLMRTTCARGAITPPINFHGLRHTWASLAVMNGVPLIVVARNLGHVNTNMVQKHYGHLADDYISEAIKAGAPRYGMSAPGKVASLR